MDQNYETRIQSLLSQMTVSEKVGQLQQCGPSLVGAFDVPFDELLNMMFDGRITQEEFARLLGTASQDYHEEDLRAGRIGSYNGVNSAEIANRLQKIAVEESRLGIPLLFGLDVIHGHQTVTPIPLAESCAWEPDLWERTGRMAAEEATSAGVHMTFAPMVDVAKDARWGRVSEGAGEDALLNASYGVAKVHGFQGPDLTREDAMLACIKHFAAYGAGEAGRDYNRVDMSLQRLWEEYLPSYQACVEAGARAIMPAFNDINGIPCTVNNRLLRDILRKKWGFNGLVISDANAIAECVNHGIAEDRRDAAAKAILAGMDMDMSSDCFVENLDSLVEAGEVPMEILDEAVADVLRVKFELGLFDRPYRTTPEREAETLLNPKYRPLAREAAQKSMVLLKNTDQLLPFKKNARLGVFGHLAGDRGQMLGAWAVGANGNACVSVVDALSEMNADYIYCTNEAEEAAAIDRSEILLAVIGEQMEESGEAASRADITLHTEDRELLARLSASGKPVVVVLINGRPLAIPEVQEQAAAILEAWHPGVEAGHAICDILYGQINPSGKLTTTFPAMTGQCPVYYAHINTGRPGGKSKFTSKYLDAPLEPLYPFGYGLSYTTFVYSDIEAKTVGTDVIVSVTVENTGSLAGDEIVQCYMRDVTGKRVRPVKQLVAFDKISLSPGQTKQVVFTIPMNKLGYYDYDMNYLVDAGKYIFSAGGSSADCISTELYIPDTQQ